VSGSPAELSPHQTLSNFDGKGFRCLEFQQPAGHVIQKHFHSSPILLFVFAGSITERIQNRWNEYRPASVVLRPAGESHTHHYGNRGVHCLAVEIGSEILGEFPEAAKQCETYSFTSDGSSFSNGLRLWRTIHRLDSARSITAEELLLRTLNGFLPPFACSTNIAPRWLRQAVEIIHESFLEDLTLSGIAKNAGVHPVYLADTFRKFYGSTVGNTIRKLRLDHAIQQLIHTELSITEIALESGFFDHSHFTNFVRQRTGLTPSALRKVTTAI